MEQEKDMKHELILPHINSYLLLLGLPPVLVNIPITSTYSQLEE